MASDGKGDSGHEQDQGFPITCIFSPVVLHVLKPPNLLASHHSILGLEVALLCLLPHRGTEEWASPDF